MSYQIIGGKGIPAKTRRTRTTNPKKPKPKPRPPRPVASSPVNQPKNRGGGQIGARLIPTQTQLRNLAYAAKIHQMAPDTYAELRTTGLDLIIAICERAGEKELDKRRIYRLLQKYDCRFASISHTQGMKNTAKKFVPESKLTKKEKTREHIRNAEKNLKTDWFVPHSAFKRLVTREAVDLCQNANSCTSGGIIILHSAYELWLLHVLKFARNLATAAGRVIVRKEDIKKAIQQQRSLCAQPMW